MGLFSSILDGIGGFVFNDVLGGVNSGLDSIGWTQHGRDQYFARNMQREFLDRQIQAQFDALHENQDFSREMLAKQYEQYIQNYPEIARLQSDAQFNLWKNQFETQFNAQNKYNAPIAQVSRMQEAGLNPNLLSGAGTTSGTNSTGMGSVSLAPPALNGSPLGGSVSPMGLPQGMSSRGDFLSQIGSFIRDIAQAKKAGSEKIGQDIENRFNEHVLDQRIAAVGLQNKWTEEKTALVQQQFSEITSRLNLMRQQVELNDKQIKWFDDEMSAKIADLKSSAEYKSVLSKYNDKERELLDAMFDDLKNYQMYSTQQMEKFVELLGKYGDAQALVGMLSQVVGSAVDVVGLFKPKVTIHKGK